MIVFRVLAHIGIAVIFGYLYIGVGAGPTQAFANYVYLFGSLLLVVYTGKMSVMMSCKYFRLKKNNLRAFTHVIQISSR